MLTFVGACTIIAIETTKWSFLHEMEVDLAMYRHTLYRHQLTGIVPPVISTAQLPLSPLG